MKTGAVCVVLLVLVCFAVSAESSLSGDWSLSVTVDPAAASPISLGTSVEAVYSVGDWSFTSSTSLGASGWSGQDFDASGAWGPFSVSAALSLDPSAIAFKKWSSTASWEYEGVSLSSTFNLTPNYVALDLSAGGAVDDLSLEIDIALKSQGDCGLMFDGVDISLGFLYCCAEISSEFSFSCDGFEEATFSVSDIAIPNLPWVTLDADLAFELAEKALDLSPSFDLGDFTCFKLYIDVDVNDNVSCGTISVYGIGLTCDIGDVSFESLSYVDGTHKLNGSYWEMIAISFDNDAACCGLTAGEVAIYFLEGGARLFDVALLEGTLSAALNERTSIDLGMTWDIQDGGFKELTADFAVAW